MTPARPRGTLARPRDAASLVVTRGEGRRAEVLLGRRPPTDRFMPNVYVFPGGRVDPADRVRPVARELAGDVARRLARRARRIDARALAVAALRETFEETGLVFGERRGGVLCPDLSRLDYLGRAITPSRNPIRYHARFLWARRRDAGGRIAGNGELLDLRWYPIEEARRLEIIDVTESILDQVQARMCGEAPPDLFVHYRGSRRVLTREP